MCVLALAWAQLHLAWSWGLEGWSDGWDRALGSLTAVFAHSDLDHLLANTLGLFAVAALLEATKDHRWLLAVFAVAIADMWFFTGEYVMMRGASGLVMAATGALWATLPAAWRAGREGLGDLHSRLLYIAATLAVLLTPLSAAIDVIGLSRTDTIAQGAHLRCLVAGCVIGIAAAVGDLLRHRTLRPAATPAFA